MTRAPLSTLLIAMTVAAGCGGGGSEDPSKPEPAAPKNVSIAIREFKFDPPAATVRVGSAITWVNRDSAPHTATAEAGAPAAFDTDNLEKGETGRVEFTRPGRYRYFCELHPFMKATLEVR